MTEQCKKCPWKVATNPREIPDGYCETKHAALRRTIAEPGSLRGLRDPQRAMACHESATGREAPCAGWLYHQLGVGNNIALRMRALVDKRFRPTVHGRQHQTFEATLPAPLEPDAPAGYDPRP